MLFNFFATLKTLYVFDPYTFSEYTNVLNVQRAQLWVTRGAVVSDKGHSCEIQGAQLWVTKCTFCGLLSMWCKANYIISSHKITKLDNRKVKTNENFMEDVGWTTSWEHSLGSWWWRTVSLYVAAACWSCILSAMHSRKHSWVKRICHLRCAWFR